MKVMKKMVLDSPFAHLGAVLSLGLSVLMMFRGDWSPEYVTFAILFPLILPLTVLFGDVYTYLEDRRNKMQPRD